MKKYVIGVGALITYIAITDKSMQAALEIRAKNTDVGVISVLTIM